MTFQKPSPGFMIASAIFFAVSLLMILVLGGSTQDTYLKVTQLPPLEKEYLKEMKVGDEVLLEGKIALDNKTLVRDFVLGCTQEYYSDEDESGWETVDEFEQPLKVLTPKKMHAVLLFQSACPNGEFSKTHYSDKVTDVRTLGYPAGIPLTVLGTVSNLQPLKIAVFQHYGNTKPHYVSHLAFTRNILIGIGMVMFLISVGLLLWGSRVKTT